MGHLAFQQERIFLPPRIKRHGHIKAPVTANLHRVGGFDLFAGIQQGGTGVLFVGQNIAPDFHADKAFCRLRMS